MTKVTRTIVLDDIGPAELAQLFCDMGDIDQAQFFSAIKPIAEKWSSAGWCMQACGIAEQIDPAGRDVITKLAEHALGYDELLASANAASEFLGGIDDATEIRDQLLSAIAKATGQ